MPDLTKNYNFKKPKANEYAKPDDFNENFEALDLILKFLRRSPMRSGICLKPLQ